MPEDAFYLGRSLHPQTLQPTGESLYYDPADLTTHAVVVGMTGSGKTGLCITLLEEAALQGIPALMLDPKGDITNTLLHFPDLLPEDFAPWLNPDEARRKGVSMEQAAQQVAAQWRAGLADWEITAERLRALKNSAHFAVYTPGSSAGLPVSILASFAAPALEWNANRELLRERISATVTGLLGLIGLNDLDPVRSREHILLANIFEAAWSQGKGLDLGELILQTQTPPFTRLGVFDINTFFPEKDRFALAMQLNNILAAPSFQSWLEGMPLDVGALLFGEDSRPRHSVFYLAHLNDSERMFFTTLLLSSLETWMRTQAGSTTLRALLYFDEIFGYLPPGRNPSSKPPLLRLLKQARAFGVGLLLATQNPVDVDYKALSNAGTWFVGRLQTEQDKQRLLDGLQGASPQLARSEVDALLSALGKRTFLLHNVHEQHPQVFTTRWAMNYLAGPLTRAQLPMLNALAGAALPVSRALPVDGQSPQAPASSPQVAAPLMETAQPVGVVNLTESAFSQTKPPLPAQVTEYFLPHRVTLSQAVKNSGETLPVGAEVVGVLYRPALLAQGQVLFVQRKYNLQAELTRAALVFDLTARPLVRWDEHAAAVVDAASLDAVPVGGACFALPEGALNDARALTMLKNDFIEWLYRSQQVTVRANAPLKVFAGPEVSSAEFRRMCSEAARAGQEAELGKVNADFARRAAALRDKLTREQRELVRDEAELSQRKMEEAGTHLENVLSLFSRRRSLTTSLTKRRLTEQAKAEVDESLAAIAEFEQQLEALAQQQETALTTIKQRWQDVAAQVEEIALRPYKKDVSVMLFGVAWVPFHLLRVAENWIELPAF